MHKPAQTSSRIYESEKTYNLWLFSSSIRAGRFNFGNRPVDKALSRAKSATGNHRQSRAASGIISKWKNDKSERDKLKDDMCPIGHISIYFALTGRDGLSHRMGAGGLPRRRRLACSEAASPLLLSMVACNRTVNYNFRS